ncbi:MAG: flap endonuclease [Acidobacteriota bacterium]|nr:flap endonuclease [Acidobacteriota bacterium]MDE2924320.1 flap endonuclease [Acidobacteriota bacterium]MDE3263970.1 flap endonuclease [Acidobacteriota bacterium]
MYVHLIDGTYELFRHHFGAPSYHNEDGLEVGAVRGVVFSVLGMFRDGATHVAVATDQVIESFRNEMWPGYKTGEGIEPELRAQFPVLEEALAALGVTVWPMVEHEADDGLASGAAMAAADERVIEVRICTPDKDLAQCVDAGRGGKTVQVDRRRGLRWEADGIREKFGVEPESIPDYLALVGDSADGFPGLRGWGAKSTATVLAHYLHLEEIPDEPWKWAVKVRGRDRLAATLREERASAELFRELATLVRDAPVSGSVDELRWRGPRPELGAVAGRLAAPGLVQQAERVAADSA